jgi:hypothetical protein
MNRGNGNIKVSFEIAGDSYREVELPIDLTVSELREQISLHKGMSHGISIDVSRINILHNENILHGDTMMGSLPSCSQLTVRILSKEDVPFMFPDTLDFGLLTQQLREISRVDLPGIQQRHMIQEHQRKASSSVAYAMTRASKNLKLFSPSTEPLLEENSLSRGIYHDLRMACDDLIELVDCVDPVSRDRASEVIHGFTDSLLSTTSFLAIESDIDLGTECTDVFEILSQRPRDGSRLAEALTGILHGAVVDGSVGKSGIADHIELLANEISKRSDLSQIVKSLTDLVIACASILHSPVSVRINGGSALLPNPTEKASLSPEMVLWARGLRSFKP